MSSWIIPISKNLPQHSRIALREKLWDMRTDQKVKVGDLVYFYLPPFGLVAMLEATESARPLQASDERPWLDSSTYKSRFHFDVLSTEPLRDAGPAQIQEGVGRRLVFSSPTELRAKVEEEAVAAFFASTQIDTIVSQDPVDIEHMQTDHSGRRTVELRDRGNQSKFREDVRRAYRNTCAITGVTTPEAVEAAHIMPFRGPQTHRVDNGILLRRDLHRLYDVGLLSIDDKFVVTVASEVHDLEYRSLDGRVLDLSWLGENAPRPEFLAHH